MVSENVLRLSIVTKLLFAFLLTTAMKPATQVSLLLFASVVSSLFLRLKATRISASGLDFAALTRTETLARLFVALALSSLRSVPISKPMNSSPTPSSSRTKNRSQIK